jgi:hypothetical protein
MNRTQWKIVAIEETSHWNADIVARAGRLFGIYLLDANRQTHCCELTPSYEVYFIETVHEKFHGEGGVHDEILEADLTEYSHYFNCRVIDRMAAKWFVTFPIHDINYETDEEWEADREEMLEMLRGNQYVPVGVPFIPDVEEEK